MTMNQWIEGDVSVNGLPIHFYRTCGTGKPTLLLAHGFSDNGLCWGRVAREMEVEFDLIMVDARNHGQSGRGICSSDDLTDDLAAVITALSIGPTFALGHSMGAGTVAGLAARYPGLVSKIALEDPPWAEDPGVEDDAKADKRREGFKKFLQSVSGMSDEAILAMGKKQHPDWRDDEFPAWVQSNRQVGLDALSGMKYRDWRDNVAKIQCDTLVIHGDEDRGGMLKQVVVDRLVRDNNSFSAHHIPGAGHNIRREQFALYLAAVRDFFV